MLCKRARFRMHVRACIRAYVRADLRVRRRTQRADAQTGTWARRRACNAVVGLQRLVHQLSDPILSLVEAASTDPADVRTRSVWLE